MWSVSFRKGAVPADGLLPGRPWASPRNTTDAGLAVQIDSHRGDQPTVASHWDPASKSQWVGDARLDRYWGAGQLRGGEAFRHLCTRPLKELSRNLQVVAGDFCFCVIEPQHRRCVLVRDHYGSRPAYYTTFDGGFAASDTVSPLLDVADGPVELDQGTIAAYCKRSFGPYGDTFFAGVKALLPGQMVTWENGRIESFEYYDVAGSLATLTSKATFEDWRQGFEHHFLQAVRRRLSGTRKIGVRLSGGLDSTSIACAIGRLRPSNAVGLAATFEGRPYDESPHIQVVAESLAYPVRLYDGEVASPADLTEPLLCAPESLSAFCGTEEPSIAANDQVQDIFCGNGGDQIISDYGVFEDVLDQRRFDLLPRLLVSPSVASLRQRLRLLRRAAAEPGPAPSASPPSWVIRRPPSKPVHQMQPGPRGIKQRAIHQTRSSVTMWALDYSYRFIASRGFDPLYPYQDRDLIEYVLNIPWTDRLPLMQFRALQRKGLVGLVPASILKRPDKAVFDRLRISLVRQHWPVIHDLFSGPTLSGQYLNRRGVIDAARLIVTTEGEPAGFSRLATLVYSAACLEAWLRRIRAYNGTR